MSLLIKGLDIDSHRVIKCFIVPYKDRAQLVVGNKYDEGKTYDIFEVSTPHGDLIDREEHKRFLENKIGRCLELQDHIAWLNEQPIVIKSEE